MSVNRTAAEMKAKGPIDPYSGPICPYCGHHSILRSAEAVYGPSAHPGSKIWICRNYKDCDAYVGAHKEGDLKDYPKGSLANPALRTARMVAHNIFDLLWKQQHMSRRQSYEWMRELINALPEDCHIGEMDIKMCNMIYVIAMKRLGIKEKSMSEILKL